MKSEGTLLVELSALQGPRLGREIALYKEMFHGSDGYNEELHSVIKDNWDTDQETSERYFNTMTEKGKSVFIK